ncbi:MAG: calcium-binding protein [Planctomycetota bacterium]
MAICFQSVLARPVAVVLASALGSAGAAFAQGQTTRVSVDSSGVQGNSHSWMNSVSADGRYVAFESLATNLVPGDTNYKWDVFVHDRQTGETTRVSVDSSAVQGNDDSRGPSISADGRFVAFESHASNLVSGDTNGFEDVFVHDRQTGQTTRVSVDSSGVQANLNSGGASISGDGRYVAFDSAASNLVPGDTNSTYDVFVHDRQTGQTTCVSVDSSGVQGNASSSFPSISADGRCVAFYSWAWNLVPGDTNWKFDVFAHDRQTGQTSRVSVDSSGVQGNNESMYPSISADGRYVAFGSSASNLVPGDTNGSADTFLHDRQTGQTTRVSVDSSGNQGNGDPLDGQFFLWPSLSGDGRYVAFHSQANNLVPGDSNEMVDVFLHDQLTGETTRVSVDSSGTQGNKASAFSSVSASGRYISFKSAATNLVAGDTNTSDDVFVRDRSACDPSVVWVDFTYVGTETGCFDSPYNTLAEGIAAVLSGGTLMIKTGSTSETPTVTKAMTLEAYGGAVTIGQ